MELDNKMVIDMDTGTVLGTNLVLVDRPEDKVLYYEVLSNDSVAWDYGDKNGVRISF